MAVSRKPHRRPHRMTAKRLENVALHYLSRYASSTGNLRRILVRRVQRAAIANGDDPKMGARLVELLIARFLRVGLIDDRTYATQKAETLQRRGMSRIGIRNKLHQKGVEADLIDQAMAALNEGRVGTGEFAAACALVRRRRLGSCRPVGVRVAMRQKDLAILARAGFTLEVARRALDTPDVANLESLARGMPED